MWDHEDGWNAGKLIMTYVCKLQKRGDGADDLAQLFLLRFDVLAQA